MSRYNEDWQRRKAYLIRSLFNDIPYRALSPVIEESISSTNGKGLEQSEQSFTSSEDRIYSEYEPYAPANRVQNVITPPVTDAAAGDRPWSPLPPLIIEREPNRHDEPLQYYQKLLIKIKNIYKKMFLENNPLSDDDDFFENDYVRNSITDRTDLNNKSSFYSNGYTADDESIDEYSIDEYNRPKLMIVDESLNDRSLGYDNGDKGAQSIVNDIDNNIDLPDEEMQLDSSVPNEEPNYSQIVVVADVHVDGHPLPEITPSPIYGEQPTEVTSVRNPILMTLESHKQLKDSRLRTSIHTWPALAYDIPEHGSSQFECAELQEQPTPIRKDSLMEHATTKLFEESASCVIQPSDPKRIEVTQYLIGGHCNKSPVLECRRQKQGSKEIIVNIQDGTDEVLEDHQAAASNQVRVQDEVHADISEPVRTVEVPQESPAKVSRSRPSGDHSQRSERDMAMLEELRDPETLVAIEHIEVMRTPRQADTSLESILGGNPRMTSDMEFTCEHNTIAQDISNVTSQSQDGGQVKDTAGQKMSVDFDEIVASIFNNSNHISRQSTENIYASRKRRYEAISVQTEGVTWNDLRSDFFVGTPKIFRLCSCVDHICG